ncbi:MAG TPA: site-specific integrase [Pseudonocardiaceae bacterium]|nr:site-specific integrase [Pseudonocardiaceae bacterium]
MAFPTPSDTTSHRGRTFRPQPLTRAELDALLDAAARHSASGVRLRALVAVMSGAGLRLAETLALMPADVNPTDGTIRVNLGKGSKTRTVGITGRSLELLEAWLTHRKTLALNGRHLVFATYSRNGSFGTPMSPQQVRAALTRLAVKAGIDKRVHPHGLRHSLAYEMARRGIPLQVIQAQLGHASLDGTSHYIGRLMPKDVVDVMRDLDW